MNIRADVIVIGAGPAGIATAIAASQRGFQSVVIDALTPPIDKPCGEGILPRGVAALRDLGIHLTADIATPFPGIRFIDERSSASAQFRGAAGLALRRIRLHQLLVDRATEAGVIFHWGTRVTEFGADHIVAAKHHIPLQIRYRWLVGADGQNSRLRKWVNLGARRPGRKRFGFHRHFRVRPWTNMVEVYWGRGCEMFVTPTGTEEVGVAVFSRAPRLRLDAALPLFPALAERLQGAEPVTAESGDTTALERLPAVTRGRVALVGDASGSVDAVTGYGLSLSFQHALHLAEAFEKDDLKHYESAHRKIAALPILMSRLMMAMNRSSPLRRNALRLFESSPRLFSSLLSLHTGETPRSPLSIGTMMDWGRKLLRAQ